MQAFISHASASLFFPEFSVALTFVHLFSKEFLVGGVLLLCVLFFTEKKRLDYKHKAVLFDAVASLMLLGAGITGTYVTWLHLKSWDNLFITEWGILFISLLLATLFLGTFRILHQFIIHPLLHTKLARVYGMTLPVEALLGLCVLFFSAYISMTTPPFTVSAYTYEAEADDFILDVHPYEESMFRIRLADVNGLEKLTAVAENTQLGIGPNVLPLQKRSNDSYVFPRSDLSPNGEWEIRFILQQSGAYDAVSSFHLKYPDDVEVTHYSHESRSFDSFALQLSIFATGFLLLCIILLVHGYVHYTKQRNEAMYAFPYAPAYLAGSFAITALLCGVYFALLFHIPGATFERMCEKAGYEWVQTYPTRDFARTSQNTYLGCKVHDGHYHFIDEAEYQEHFPSEE
jgi:hypothetical protein